MAGKRINKSAPLTSAEKQTAADKQTERLREQFKKEVDELSPDQLMKLIDLHDNPPEYPQNVTMKEFCALTGVTEYEFKKLEAQGIIKPIEPTHPSGLTKKEIANIERTTGLTADEFLHFIKFCEKPMTLPELSKAANIPLRKLEKMNENGMLYQTA